MRAAIRIGAEDGLGLSLLFPAVTALYRHLGWELSGALVRYRLDARRAPARGAPLRAATAGDWPAIRACHEATGRSLEGPSVRPAWRWRAIRDVPFTYVLDAEDGGSVEAYLCYAIGHEGGDWQYSLEVEDWGATSARGYEALLGFLARHGTIGKDMVLTGPVPHPWTFLLPEQDLDRSGGMDWMARGLDLGAAVAARGFAPGVTAGVGIAVDDPLLPGSGGPWRLEVADGAGKLSPAGSATVTLSARAVGPLFTGRTSAHDLARIGLVHGPDADLAALSAPFAGPTPIQLDFF
jgi:predicted acetyltransferase